MIRTSKHTLKFSNQNKLDLIERFYTDYKFLLQSYVDMIVSKKLPLKSFLSSKDLPILNNIYHSQWKQIAYKQAAEIIRSLIVKTKNKVYKKYKYLYAKSIEDNRRNQFLNLKFRELNIDYLKRIPKIDLKNISIPIDSRLVDVIEGNNTFDEFLKINTPYFRNKRRAITVKIPLKHHKQSNKFRLDNWIRKNTVMLRKKNDMFYIDLFWEKENTPVNKDPLSPKPLKSVGIDVGYKKLISSSSGKHYGKELFNVYAKISRKIQGSNAFKRSLIERDELTNFYVKEFIKTENPDILYIEKLKNVKSNSKGKIYKKTMNKLQRWSYTKTFEKLKLLSEEEGFLIKDIPAAYTSQTCSNCGNRNKYSRNGEIYDCVNCKKEMDADTNASMNILHKGQYGAFTMKSLNL